MTAREVVDLIKKNSGVTWNEQSIRDTFKVGNPDSQVKGIASTMMTTLDVQSSIRLASESGEKPAKTTEWIAPIRAQASTAYAASGIIGR